MGIVDDLARALYPGQQILRVNGWEGLKKFAMPWNSSAIFLDTDPNEDHFYIKSVDSAGHETMSRHKYYEDPVEEIDPSKYARKSDLENTKEEILNAIDRKLTVLLTTWSMLLKSVEPLVARCFTKWPIRNSTMRISFTT